MPHLVNLVRRHFIFTADSGLEMLIAFIRMKVRDLPRLFCFDWRSILFSHRSLDERMLNLPD
jgi:hypothetical protein